MSAKEQAAQLLETLERLAVEHALGVLAERAKTDDTAWPLIREVAVRREAHPLVAKYLDVFVQRAVNQARIRYYGASLRPCVDAEERAPFTPAEDKLMKAMDEGWSGEGWRPSTLYTIGLSITDQPKTYRRWARREATRLWNEGYWPNIFLPKGDQPLRRPA